MGPRLDPRLENWPARLDAVVEARRHEPFAWGEQDCVTFAAACVEALTGQRPLDGLPAWASSAQAERAIAAAGGLEAGVSARFQELPLAFAQRGDLLLLDVDGLGTLGVCLGATAAAPGKRGLVFPETLSAHRAWRVGG